MAPIITDISDLANVLASSEQLETSSSQLDGVPKELEDSVRFHAARLLFSAGILLRLPQDIIAQAITILYRYWVGPDGGSLLDHDARMTAAAALYLTAKPSSYSVSPRQLLTVFDYLRHVGLSAQNFGHKLDDRLSNWRFSDGDYELARDKLYDCEARILRVLGFETRVALPYKLCINYLQTLDVFTSPKASSVARRAVAHLNSALLSPQLLYLTHQPYALATSAIYLSAMEIGANMPETEWWEVFDTDREELGFLVVAFQSIQNFAREEVRKWSKATVPLTTDELREEIAHPRRLLEPEV